MPTIAAVSRERHGALRWKRYSNYKFAAHDAVAPLVINELPQATLVSPIAFTMQEDHLIPVAMLGLEPGQNLMVGSEGQWKGKYIPALYRSYPFLMAPADGREVLCINEDSGLITGDNKAEAFFEGDDPSNPLQEILSFLQLISENRKTTLYVCAQLKRYGLIEPWPISLRTPEGDKRVDGLSRIAEAALNALPSDAFLEVRQFGGLVVAYCQLLSMQHLSALAQLSATRAEVGARRLPINQAGDLDLEFLNDGPLMDFSRLR